MSLFGVLLAAISALLAAYFYRMSDTPSAWRMSAAFAALGTYALTIRRQPKRPKRNVVVRMKGLVWTREDFCRGWLITGDTGSGKTRSGITPLLHQIFQNEPGWGGVCIDDKGLYWETLSEMVKHFNR